MRLSLQRLWIALGEAARRYCQAEDVEPRMPPWADMIGFRDKLAHLYLREVSNELLWQPGARELPEWRRIVEDLLVNMRRPHGLSGLPRPMSVPSRLRLHVNVHLRRQSMEAPQHWPRGAASDRRKLDP